MKKIRFIFKYLLYRLTSQTKHDIHSPFVFDLLTNVIEDTTPFYAYKEIEALRKELLKSAESVKITDYGAGSSFSNLSVKRIKDIARHSAKTPKYGQLLFRIINYLHPETLLELGTSLGISTLYQVMPSSKSKMITIEGCPEIAQFATGNFKKLKVENIELMLGNFDDVLLKALQKNKKTDYVFFDGNHRKEPTIRYFEQCLPFIQNDTFFVFDDIHWSKEMEEAWQYIKNHSRTTVTIDLFFLGLVFFRKEQKKQHFVIRF